MMKTSFVLCVQFQIISVLCLQYTIVCLYYVLSFHPSSDLSLMIPEGCPLSYETIVNEDIDTFNDFMGKYRFTEEEITHFREIRRKGKNRVS